MRTERFRWMAARRLVDAMSAEDRALLRALLEGDHDGDMVRTMLKQAGDPPWPDVPAFDLVRLAEVRYALGRNTGAPGLLVDNLLACWDTVGAGTREAIASEVGEALAEGRAGDAHVVEDWLRLLRHAGAPAVPAPCRA